MSVCVALFPESQKRICSSIPNTNAMGIPEKTIIKKTKTANSSLCTQPAATRCSLSALFLPKNVPMLIKMLCVGPDKDKTKPSHYETRVAAVCSSKNCCLFSFKKQPVQAILQFTIKPPTIFTPHLDLAKGIDTKRWRLHQQVRRYSLGLPPLKEVVAL